MQLPSQPIRLIAIDIDGTLLNPQKQITPRTRDAIQTAQQAGIFVTLATARRYGNSRQFANEIKIAMPLITCDGALVVHHPDQKVLHSHLLPAAIAHQAVEAIVRHQVQPIVQHVNGGIEETWTGHKEYDNQELAAYFSLFPEALRIPYTSLCQDQPAPLRVVAFASEEAITKLVPEISQLSCSWYTVKRGSYGCAEISIMHEHCSKATGVKKLAEHLGIPLTQVMAIGDNTNDIAMLKAVGWGVAMGQATDNIKAVAQAVTASNQEDGVAEAIERYALLLDRQTVSNSLNRATCL